MDFRRDATSIPGSRKYVAEAAAVPFSDSPAGSSATENDGMVEKEGVGRRVGEAEERAGSQIKKPLTLEAELL